MILDTYSKVFVWVGREAREDEVKEALKITVEYVRTDPSNRDLASTELLQVCDVASTHILLSCSLIFCSSLNPPLLPSPQVKQGFEPPTFSCHFLGWNPNLWAQDNSYETYLKQVTQGVTSGKEELKKYDEGRKFPYEQLKGKCPQGVNPTIKEVNHRHNVVHYCFMSCNKTLPSTQDISDRGRLQEGVRHDAQRISRKARVEADKDEEECRLVLVM